MLLAPTVTRLKNLYEPSFKEGMQPQTKLNSNLKQATNNTYVKAS